MFLKQGSRRRSWVTGDDAKRSGKNPWGPTDASDLVKDVFHSFETQGISRHSSFCKFRFMDDLRECRGKQQVKIKFQSPYFLAS